MFTGAALRRVGQTVVLLTTVLSFATSASAQDQDFPRVSGFAGYSQLRISAPNEFAAFLNNVFGWGASVTNNVSRNFGITADFSGHYRNVYVEQATARANAHSFMFGPTFTFRRVPKVTPFVHGLAGIAVVSGVARESRKVKTKSNSGFVGAVGGGLDISLSRSFGLRFLEVDYLPAHNREAGTLHNVRWRSGLTFSFGK